MSPDELIDLAKVTSRGRWWQMTDSDRLFYLAGVAAEHIAQLRLLNESYRVGRHSWLDQAEERDGASD